MEKAIYNKPNFLQSIYLLIYVLLRFGTSVKDSLKKSHVSIFLLIHYTIISREILDHFKKSSNVYNMLRREKTSCILKNYSYFANSLFNSFKSNFCFSVILLGILTNILTN